MQRNRREFLGNVGNGMLIAGLGATIASDIGINTAWAEDGSDRLAFGDFRPLITRMQETPPERLQPELIRMLSQGETNLRQLIAAAALANAETFGGEDYVGYHAEMALIPALTMARDLPEERRALPVLKVIYRNTERIQETGRARRPTLTQIPASDIDGRRIDGTQMRDATRDLDLNLAEKMLAAQNRHSQEAAFNSVLWSVQDAVNVHRFVLAHRAWSLIDLVGEEHAETMLRQCVRYCISEDGRGSREFPIRQLIPRLLDEHKLLAIELGDHDPGDEWVDEMAMLMYRDTPDQAATAVAIALAEGISPEVIGEATSLASNQLALRKGVRFGDGNWRAHGDSPGVHGSDSANAWRNITRHCSHRNRVVGLMVSAYHTARFRTSVGVGIADPYPHEALRESIVEHDAGSLLAIADEAIRANDHDRAAASIHNYVDAGFAPRPALDMLLRYAVSEDGRLHSEKYYQTVVEEFRTTREAFRSRQLISLARVMASSYGMNRTDEAGYRAAGYEDACRLLNVEV